MGTVELSREADGGVAVFCGGAYRGTYIGTYYVGKGLVLILSGDEELIMPLDTLREMVDKLREIEK